MLKIEEKPFPTETYRNSILQFRNIIEALQFWAEIQPEKVVYRLLANGDQPTETITYQALLERAQALAGLISQKRRGASRAVLIYPFGIEFIVALLACFMAGVVAVPVYPPRMNRSLDRILSILRDCVPDTLLSTAELISNFQRKFQPTDTINQIGHISTDHPLPQNTTAKFTPHDIAFLQYTSGSTSKPKGVMVSHANIIANESMISNALGCNRETIAVGWLPLFHDMGLIGNTLQTLYAGFTITLFSPMHFLQKPIRWLQAITDYRATISGGPNFAYELCIENVFNDDLKRLDLSCWQVAFNGAEPIHYSTIKRFSEKFATVGFKKSVFLPCYGMAETTLLVSGDPNNGPETLNLNDHRIAGLNISQYANNDYHLVSSGRVDWGDQTVKIVDPKTTRPLPSNTIGEIWVTGAHVTKGYFNNPELTQIAFDAYTDSGEGPFLKTGDLGFINHSGALFITGRIKDMIIVRGKNYYPQDIEYFVERLSDAFNLGSTIAFSTQNPERLVCCVELKRSYLRKDIKIYQQLSSLVRAGVNDALIIVVDQVVLLRTNSIPKTSSGKVQRSRTKHMLQAKLFDVVFDSSLAEGGNSAQITLNPHDSISSCAQLETYMAQLISKQTNLPVDLIQKDSHFTSFGLDSLGLIDLSNALEQVIHRPVSIEHLVENPTIQSLSQCLLKPPDSTEDKVLKLPRSQHSSSKKTICLPTFDT